MQLESNSSYMCSFLESNSISEKQTENASVDFTIFRDWLDNFLDKAAHLQAHGREILLMFGGYGFHVQCSILMRMHEAKVDLFAFPAHTSHVLQSMDFSVFGSFKNYV